MDIENEVKKCEESGAVFTVDHIGSELEISNASRLEKTQVDWLKSIKMRSSFPCAKNRSS